MTASPVRRAARSLRARYRASPWKWHLDNLAATTAYRRGRRALAAPARRVVDELGRRGIARTSAQALLGDAAAARAVSEAVARIERDRAGEIAAARAEAGEVRESKSFVFKLREEVPVLDPEDPFLRFALQPEVRAIANAYFGLYAQLRYYNVWHTFATDAPAQRSQLWHRDRDDRRILKLFFYLSEVDETAGPLVYAPGTHSKGPIRREPESFFEPGRGNPRSTDAQMAAVVPETDWVRCLGEAGTIVFADTTGYHKGGLARGRDRIVYTCMFVSPASPCRVFFAPPASPPAALLEPETALALGLR